MFPQLPNWASESRVKGFSEYISTTKTHRTMIVIDVYSNRKRKFYFKIFIILVSWFTKMEWNNNC
jgi:hypothetical protein